ncbi:MAG: hypothetical protein HKN49_11625 [Gammaproteobacteria bacterium]|nr:hypothetical protein [Gammaproteobacteria bacterium]
MSQAIDNVTSPPVSWGVDGDRAAYKRSLLISIALFLVSTIVAALTLPGDTAGGWGMFATTWLFLFSVSSFGVAFTAIMRLTGGKWARPLFRTAEVVTLAYLPFAFIGLLLIFYFARDQLFFWYQPAPGEHLSSWLGENKLLVRNLVGLSVFYLASIIYVRRTVQPDLIPGESTGPLRGLVSSVFGGKPKREAADLTGHLYRYAVVLLMIAALATTFISWDFAMMLWPHYHSTIFSMYFMVGSIYGGLGFLLLVMATLRKYIRVETVFGTRQIKNMGIMMTGFMCLWLYFFWAQFFVTWFGNLPHEMRPLNAQMYGHYGPIFWISVACLFALPLSLLIFAWVKRNLWSASVVAGLIVAGVFLNRYLMVLPAQWPDHMPFTTLGGVFGSVALLSGYRALMLLLFDAFPMLSRWEIEHIPAEQRAHWHSKH